MTPSELLDFTGASGDRSEKQAQAALTMAEGMVDAYTRGKHKRGDRYRPGVQDVITLVAARILANPLQVQQREAIGPYSYFVGDGFQGFTLAELAVLNRYRKRAR